MRAREGKGAERFERQKNGPVKKSTSGDQQREPCDQWNFEGPGPTVARLVLEMNGGGLFPYTSFEGVEFVLKLRGQIRRGFGQTARRIGPLLGRGAEQG